VTQASRIAWLESRIRQPKMPKEEAVPDVIEPIKSFKSNITERRHRVLALASRGQSAEMIASTLGMMAGEVELIVKFNQANVAVA
jgi:DNA-binding NarL/FixJ family response regulator